MPRDDIAQGTVIRGKYRIERVLGQGGMGTVVLATHVRLEQLVAIKLLNVTKQSRPKSAARFAREAKLAAQLQSDHVVRILDVDDTDEGEPFFVMEYLRGSDLGSVLDDEGPMPIALAVDYALQACEALAVAHAMGIVHRDIKPANLFLATAGDGSRLIKLLDFGIGKDQGAEGAALTDTDTAIGSPLYMSPEQLLRSADVDHRTDIWSLGVTLYQLVSGKLPFEASTAASVAAHIAATPAMRLSEVLSPAPAAFEAAVMRCLEKPAADRHDGAVDLAEALAPFAAPDARGSAARVRRAAAATADVVAQQAAEHGAQQAAESRRTQTAAERSRGAARSADRWTLEQSRPPDSAGHEPARSASDALAAAADSGRPQGASTDVVSTSTLSERRAGPRPDERHGRSRIVPLAAVVLVLAAGWALWRAASSDDPGDGPLAPASGSAQPSPVVASSAAPAVEVGASAAAPTSASTSTDAAPEHAPPTAPRTLAPSRLRTRASAARDEPKAPDEPSAKEAAPSSAPSVAPVRDPADLLLK